MCTQGGVRGVQDLFQLLRPDMPRFETFEEAAEAVMEIEANEAAGIGLDDDADSIDPREAGPLPPAQPAGGAITLPRVTGLS